MRKLFIALLLFSGIAHGQFAKTPTTGLVYWVKICGDTTGSSGCVASSSATVYDSSSGKNNGSWNGSQSGTTNFYSAGKVGPYAGYFNGTNNYISNSALAALNFTNTTPFSACAWVNPTALTGVPTVIAKQQTTTPYPGWLMQVLTSGSLSVYIGSNSTTNLIDVYTGPTLISTATWTHVCFTYSGSSTAAGVALYVNGSPVTPVVGNNTLSASIANSAIVVVGATSSGLSKWVGTLNDVRVYNRVLTAGEVALLAQIHN